MQVSGEDRVLQLVQNAGLKNGLIHPSGDMASTAPRCRFLRVLGWRSRR
jgi:hypothetical protein